MDGRMDIQNRRKNQKRVMNEVKLIEEYENRNDYNFIKRKIVEYKFKNYLKNKPKTDMELRTVIVNEKI